MISRRRSGPTAAAMSMEYTTSANKMVTCLYSAGECDAVDVPHSRQNLALSCSSVAHEGQAVIAAPRLSPLQPSSVSPGCPAQLRIGVADGRRTFIDVRLWRPARPPACPRTAWSAQGWSTATAGTEDRVRCEPIG